MSYDASIPVLVVPLLFLKKVFILFLMFILLRGMHIPVGRVKVWTVDREGWDKCFNFVFLLLYLQFWGGESQGAAPQYQSTWGRGWSFDVILETPI